MSTTGLIAIAILGIALLLFLIMHSKVQAFVALLIASLFIGIAAGLPLEDIIASIEGGMGGTLGFIAVVVGLGAMFGEMLRVSGGAERLAGSLIHRFGEERAQWSMGFAGFLVAIPVFFDVGLVILIPLIYSLVGKTGRSLLFYGIPLLAGLAVTHAFVPPTPGPIAVASVIGADIGWVILFGLLAGIPAMIVAGPLFGRYIAKRIHLTVPEYVLVNEEKKKNEKELPSFGLVLSLILIPLVLILSNTLSGLLLAEGDPLRSIFNFVGHPFVALTIATLLAFYLLGRRRGYSKQEVQTIATKAMEPAGIIILVTGAGGVFKETLINTGIGDVMGELMKDTNLPIVLLAFLIAALVRVAQGSATVAMITAAGLTAPVLETMDPSAPLLGLIVIAIASGATVLSHVNDSGFWLVNRYFGMTEKQTLQSWTVMATLIGLVGVTVALVISFFV